MKWLAGLFFLAVALAGCSSKPAPHHAGVAGPPDWQRWKQRRLESLAGTNGWTTLMGLHWLEEGANPAGTSPSYAVVLPAGRAPENVGVFIRKGFEVRFESAAGTEATISGQGVTTAVLRSDVDPDPTRLQIGSLSIFLLKRGDRMALRVRDPQAPSRLQFQGVKTFPYDPAWRLEGRYERFTFEKKLRVSDATGGVQEFISPGAVYFPYGSGEYPIEVAVEPGEDRFFLMFRDKTSGKTTYPSGRFLYVEKPDAQGRLTIDFNQSYTPPCGFTPFATCPIPPKQNWLPMAIKAGELAPASHP